MELGFWKTFAILTVPLLALAAQAVFAESEDLGNGFMHHGVATPVSNHRGTVATVDGDGNNVVLVWLFDHTGGYALLMIDAQTGEAKQVAAPFRTGDCPYASVLSSGNRYYTHFGSHFCEFDPTVGEFTFFEQTTPQMAMSMTEDDEGVIWSATYPQSGVVSYDPESGEMRDYGHVYTQNWRQYPRSVAADDQGWVYFGVGSTASQIIILNRETGEATPVIPEDQRAHGSGTVYRDMDGKVYGTAPGGLYYELYGGQAQAIEALPERNAKPIITGSQGLFHRNFPNGERLASVDLVNRKMAVTTAEGETRELEFDYTSEGAHLMGLAAAPDGTICGGTAFPMRFFRYDPVADEWTNRAAYGQWNTVAPTEDRFWVGGYGHGFLLEWDPSREWVTTAKDNADCNPLYLTAAHPDINRPHDLLPYPDGRTIILAGTPGYGLTGGGLMFWDRETQEATVVAHEQLIEDQSVMSMVPLRDGKLLCGTTIAAGTGGEVKASLAELFILDLATKQIEWREPAIAGARNYSDMILAPNGLVYGVVDSTRFFVFGPATREVIRERDLEEEFGRTNGQQGPRIFVPAPDGRIFMLFQRGIAEINTEPHSHEIEMLADSPVGVGPGGDYLDGRIYFGSGSHVYSWQVPVAE